MSLNYQLPLLDAYHAKHPETPLLAGETHCVISTRGSHHTQLTPWGAGAEETWRHISERPFVAGFFIWSGFDYRGEPTPHGWPYVSSQFGQLDLCGFPKDGFFLHQRLFGAASAHSNAEQSRPAVSLGLEIHPAAGARDIAADGQFALPITVFALDAANRRAPAANDFVTFSLTGPARIIGVGNGDPTSHEPDKTSARSLFHGLAQVILQTTTTPGTITLTALADGLATATLTFHSHAAALKPSISPARRRHFVTDWRMSAITPHPPDVNQQYLEQDVNSWDRVEPGRPQAAWETASGYASYRATIALPKSVQASGGDLVFHAIAGTADVYIDGVRVAAARTGSLTIPLPMRATSTSITLIVHADTAPAGLTGRVEILPGEPQLR